MTPFSLKLPEGMLEKWREAAKRRKVSLSQLIRESVNREIEKDVDKSS